MTGLNGLVLDQLDAGATDNAEPAIEARAIRIDFDDRAVLKGVDLQVARGARTALLGCNGAGKSTLIRTLCGLMRPTSGEVLLDGRRLASDPSSVRRQIGVVGHQSYLYPELTVAENLQFYARLYRIPQSAARVTAVLDTVGLSERRHERAQALSRGLTQRLALARAILHDPPILLLDEPDAGIDLHGMAMLAAVLGVVRTDDALMESAEPKPHRRPRTVLLSTHDFGHALRLCDTVAILHDGRIVDLIDTADLELSELNERFARLTAGGAARRPAATAPMT